MQVNPAVFTKEQEYGHVVLYGQNHHFGNVTLLALASSTDKFVLRLPPCDMRRAQVLGDPLFLVCKSILICGPNNEQQRFDHNVPVEFALHRTHATTKALCVWQSIRDSSTLKRCSLLHLDAVLHLLCLLFVTPQSRVMQFGGSNDRGFTSVVLSRILNNPMNQLTVIEPDAEIRHHITSQRDANQTLSTQAYRVLSTHASQSPRCATADVLVFAGLPSADHVLTLHPFSSRIHTVLCRHDYVHHGNDRDLVRALLSSLGFRVAYTHAKNEDISFYEVWKRNSLVSVPLGVHPPNNELDEKHVSDEKEEKQLCASFVSLELDSAAVVVPKNIAASRPPISNDIVAKQCPWCGRMCEKIGCAYIFACGEDETQHFQIGLGCGRAFCFECASVDGDSQKGRYCTRQYDPQTGVRLPEYRTQHDATCCTTESGFNQALYCPGGHSSHCPKRW